MTKTKYYLKTNQGVVLGVVKVNEENNVLHWNEVVGLLNTLHQENQELQKEVKDWKFINDFQEKEIDGLKELLKEKEYVEEENEQLQQQLQEKQKHITHLESKIHRMREQIHKLEKLYHYRSGDLKRENEELRQQIKRLKHFKDLCRRYCECEKIKGNLYE